MIDFSSPRSTTVGIENSVLLINLTTSPKYLTDKRLCAITFSAENIEKIKQSLNPNKAHGHDNLRIRMLKLRGDAICEPLGMNI